MKIYLLVLIALCIVLAVAGLAFPGNLDSRDQALQGLYVLDVFYNGNYILPYAHGTEPASKPPLYNWIAALVSIPFGEVNEVSIKIPAILSAIGLVLVTFFFARKLLGDKAGFISALILIANFHFIKLETVARTDMMLTFFITLSLFLFYKGYVATDGKVRGRYYFYFYVVCALGTLTKGLVALALPALAIFIYLWVVSDLRHIKEMRIFTGAVVYSVLVLAWFIPALLIGGKEFWNKVVVNEMWERFWGIGSRSEATRPFYYLWGHLLGKFLPWSIFLPFAIWRVFPIKRSAAAQPLLFPFIWFATFFIFFTISAGKRADYIFLLYPAGAIVVAYLLDIEMDVRRKVIERVFIVTFIVLPFAFLGLVIFYSIPLILAKTNYFGNRALSLEIGIIIDIILLVIVLLTSRIIKKRKIIVIIPLLLVTIVLNIGWIIFGINSSSNLDYNGDITRKFCKKVENTVGNKPIYFFGVHNSILFYLKRNVRQLSEAEVKELAIKGGDYVVSEARAIGRIFDYKDVGTTVIHELTLTSYGSSVNALILLQFHPQK